jgi:hypothetical protein
MRNVNGNGERKMVTLFDKKQQLLATVGMPTPMDWQLLVDDAHEMAVIIEKANTILLTVLEECRKGSISWNRINERVYGPLQQLATEYPEAGVDDSEARDTIARFFAFNYDPAVYEEMRYPYYERDY